MESVYEAIRNGAATEKAVAKATGQTVRQARAIIGAMLWSGLVVRDSLGYAPRIGGRAKQPQPARRRLWVG